MSDTVVAIDTKQAWPESTTAIRRHPGVRSNLKRPTPVLCWILVPILLIGLAGILVFVQMDLIKGISFQTLHQDIVVANVYTSEAQQTLGETVQIKVEHNDQAFGNARFNVVIEKSTFQKEEPRRALTSEELAVRLAVSLHLEELSQDINSSEYDAETLLEGEQWWSVEAFTATKSRAIHEDFRTEGAKILPGASLPKHVGTTNNLPCKVSILDVQSYYGAALGAAECDMNDISLWPFSQPGHTIAGSTDGLPAQEYQYSQEFWLSQSIKQSSRYTDNMEAADSLFIDTHCYHTAWLSYMHPHGGKGLSNVDGNPLVRGIRAIRDTHPKFQSSKGKAFTLMRPSPMTKGLFKEDEICDEMSSVFTLVPESSSLCVWTSDAATKGNALILPYVAVTDMPARDWNPILNATRDLFITFQGGCGSRDLAVRNAFYAGKMMRLSVVEEIARWSTKLGVPAHANCACDICEGLVPHDQLMEIYRRSLFCPIMPGNAQSSRRLSEVILNGCIPVFIGGPFHSLPLAQYIHWNELAVFIKVKDTHEWIDSSSSNWRLNDMINLAWKLDYPVQLVEVDTLEDALDYLKSRVDPVPLQIQLKNNAHMFDYRLKEDGSPSRLSELVMDTMCDHAL